MPASPEDAAVCPLSELPAACLRNILQCLWPDARDAAAFACCCSTIRTLCDDQLLWRELLVKRYGERVIPGIKPTPEQTRPAEIEGYVFYQGQDGSEESDAQHADADLAQLAKLAHDAGAEAFTTCGKVIKCLAPQQAWRHSSFKPYEGMYVKLAAVQYRELQEPQPASDLADSSWPPQVPGWVYFPSCVSPGHHKLEPADTLARYQTLQAALRAAEQRYHVVAVTSEGEMKTKLRPQACWEVHPSYDVGLYVRVPHVQQLRLVPSPAVPDYRTLCSQLQQLRLDAAHMTCAWLNDTYLSLQEADDSPADSGMALVLNTVWWLDITGSIPGVPPGCYEVSWVVDVTSSYLDNVTITLSAEAVPVHAKQQQQQQQQQEQQAAEPAAVGTSAAGAAAAAAAADEAAGAGASPQNKVEVQQRWEPDLRRLQRMCRARNATWGVVSGGLLHVTDYSTVQLRFSSTENTYKQHVRWAMAELIPVEPQQQQQQAAAQCNRVWQASAGQGHRVGQGRVHEGVGGGGAPDGHYAQAILGWLERMFGARIE